MSRWQEETRSRQQKNFLRKQLFAATHCCPTGLSWLKPNPASKLRPETGRAGAKVHLYRLLDPSFKKNWRSTVFTVANLPVNQ